MTSRETARGLIIAVGLIAATGANAEPISTTGSPQVAIDTANTSKPSTIQLNATSSPEDVTSGGQFTQGVTFISGYDGTGGPVPFTVTETLNGSTVTISGTLDVSPTDYPDSVTLAASGPFLVGDLAFTSETLTFLDSPPFPGGTVTETLTFDVPEPASLAILGSALLGIVVLRRRRC